LDEHVDVFLPCLGMLPLLQFLAVIWGFFATAQSPCAAMN
jgi:hypothetical protein